MTPAQEYEALVATLPALGCRIVKKANVWWWRVLATLYRVITFGKSQSLLTGYTTTIGKTFYVPDDYDSWNPIDKLETVTHELVHIEQARRLTPVVFFLLYTFAYFPVVAAWWRYRLEREAYVIGFKKTLEYAPQARQQLIDKAVDQMTGPGYFWAWPFKRSVRAFFEAQLPKP